MQHSRSDSYLRSVNLITGATGLIGAQILRELLNQEQAVRALYRSESGLNAFKKNFAFLFSSEEMDQTIQWVKGNVCITDEVEHAMQGCEVVYHCAAKVSFHPKDNKELFDTNVGGTTNVVNCALEQGVSALCFISSTAAIGRTHPGQTIDEKASWKDSPLNTQYAISKHFSELEVWRGAEEGLNVVIVNPSIVVGAGDFSRGSAYVYSQAEKGFPMLPTGSNAFVDVKDVAECAVALVKRKVYGERFILAGSNMDYKDFLILICKSIGKTPPSKLATPAMLNFAARIEKIKETLTGKRAFITKESVGNVSNRVIYDNTKIKKTLGKEFIPIEESVKNYAAIFLAR